MTIPEAQEQLETLSAKLTCCRNQNQRVQLESQIARCYRVIQSAQQRARQSLASVADILLDLTTEFQLTPAQLHALHLTAEFIHRATTEQLAMAVPAAITDQNVNAALLRTPALKGIDAILRQLHKRSASFEHRLALRTALILFANAERSQILQISRKLNSSTDAIDSLAVACITTTDRQMHVA